MQQVYSFFNAPAGLVRAARKVCQRTDARDRTKAFFAEESLKQSDEAAATDKDCIPENVRCHLKT